MRRVDGCVCAVDGCAGPLPDIAERAAFACARARARAIMRTAALRRASEPTAGYAQMPSSVCEPAIRFRNQGLGAGSSRGHMRARSCARTKPGTFCERPSDEHARFSPGLGPAELASVTVPVSLQADRPQGWARPAAASALVLTAGSGGAAAAVRDRRGKWNAGPPGRRWATVMVVHGHRDSDNAVPLARPRTETVAVSRTAGGHGDSGNLKLGTRTQLPPRQPGRRAYAPGLGVRTGSESQWDRGLAGGPGLSPGRPPGIEPVPGPDRTGPRLEPQLPALRRIRGT